MKKHFWRYLILMVVTMAVFSGGHNAQAETLVLKGKVVDSKGTLVSGATLLIRDAAYYYYTAKNSDSSGNFEIYNFPAGTYTVEVIYANHAKDQAPDPISVDIKNGVVTDMGNVALVAPNIIGTAKDPTGTAIKGATVYVQKGSNSKSGTTDTDGNVYFYMSGSGDYLLTPYDLLKSGKMYHAPAASSFKHDGSKTTNLGTIQYKNPNVKGTLKLYDGTTVIEGAYTTLDNAGGISTFSKVFSTTSTGEFQFYIPTAGSYILNSYPNRTDSGNPDSETITMTQAQIDGAEVTTVNVRTVIPNMFGKIETPTGTAVQNVSVTAKPTKSSPYVTTTTDSSGNFKLALKKDDTYTIDFIYNSKDYSVPAAFTVTHTGAEKHYYDGTNGSSTLKMRNVAMKGKVKKPNGDPAASILLSINDSTYTVAGTKSGMTDSNGDFVIHAVPTGTYTLKITSQNSTDNLLLPPDPKTISLTEGTTHTTYVTSPLFMLEPQKELYGQVIDTKGKIITDAKIIASTYEGGWGAVSTTTNSSGNWSIKVGKGKWTITIVSQDAQNGTKNWAFYGQISPVQFNLANDEKESREVAIKVLRFSATAKGCLKYPDGSVPPEQDQVSISASSDNGAGNWMFVGKDGCFSMKLPPGNFRVMISSNNQKYASPDISTFTTKDDETLNLGNLTFVEKRETISGKITDGSGNPLEGITVNAWKVYGSGWAYTTTGKEGTYKLNVSAGTWEVDSWWGASSTETGSANRNYVKNFQPERVIVNNNDNIENINFSYLLSDATINGTMQTSDGTVLKDLQYIWVYAKDASSKTPYYYNNIGSNLVDGRFSLKVPSGKAWTLGAYLPWAADYSVADTSSYTPKANETINNAVITVLKNDALIGGAITDGAGKILTDAVGSIAAENSAGSHQWTQFKGGGYSMKVAKGTWKLNYWVDPQSGYDVTPGTIEDVTVDSGKTVNRDIALVANDSVISGQVLDPDGKPLANVYISVDKYLGGKSSSAELNSNDWWYNRNHTTDSDGKFSLKIPAGEYFVSAHYAPDKGYTNPPYQKVKVDPKNPASLEFSFSQSNVKITGTVTLNKAKSAATISVWSEKGVSAQTTTSDGSYSLSIQKDDTIHIAASHQTETKYYRSKEYALYIDENEKIQNLELEEKGDLPTAVSATFDAAQAFTLELADGSEVFMPAGSVASGESITVSATPNALLPNTTKAKSIGFGYDLKMIYATGTQKGTSITTFPGNITITLKYTKEQLDDLGITADDILPMFYNSTQGVWESVQTPIVNETDLTVSFTVNHLTSFGIVTGARTTIAPVITLSSPAESTKVSQNSIIVSGTINDGSLSLNVSLNKKSLGSVNPNSKTGKFSKTVSDLALGTNSIKVSAKNSAGEATLTKEVTYQTTSEEQKGVPSGIQLDLVTLIYSDNGPLIQIFDTDGKKKSEFYAYNKSMKEKINFLTLDTTGDGPKEIIVVPQEGSSMEVRIFSQEGKLQESFLAYPKGWKLGALLASEDVNQDFLGDIVVRPLKGNGTIRVFAYSKKAKKFQLVTSLKPFSLAPTGTDLEFGDVNADGTVDMIVSPFSGGESKVKVYTFNKKKNRFLLTGSFSPYPKNFRDGLQLTIADVDGDDINDIVVAPEAKSRPRIQVYEYNKTKKKFQRSQDFYAFNKKLARIINIKSANIDDKDGDELIVAPGKGSNPEVRVYTHKKTTRKMGLMNAFLAGSKKFIGGVELTVTNVDGDAYPEILTNSASSSDSVLRLFEYNPKTKKVVSTQNFNVFAKSFKGVMNVKANDLDGDGDTEILAAPRIAGSPLLRMYHFKDGKMKVQEEILTYDKNFKKGVTIGTIH